MGVRRKSLIVASTSSRSSGQMRGYEEGQKHYTSNLKVPNILQVQQQAELDEEKNSSRWRQCLKWKWSSVLVRSSAQVPIFRFLCSVPRGVEYLKLQHLHHFGFRFCLVKSRRDTIVEKLPLATSSLLQPLNDSWKSHPSQLPLRERHVSASGTCIHSRNLKFDNRLLLLCPSRGGTAQIARYLTIRWNRNAWVWQVRSKRTWFDR